MMIFFYSDDILTIDIEPVGPEQKNKVTRLFFVETNDGIFLPYTIDKVSIDQYYR